MKENIVSVFGQKQVLSMLLLALFSVWELWGCGGFRLGGGVLVRMCGVDRMDCGGWVVLSVVVECIVLYHTHAFLNRRVSLLPSNQY